MMRVGLACGTGLALLPQVLAQFGYTIQNGRTRLLGSSFGFPGVNQTFDYVVVGGGVAGLTAAARLAENASLSVAVIEAGTFYEIAEGNSSQIPGFTALFAQQNATDWNQYSTPQRQLNGRQIHYPQGKCLGGGSCRNGMLYQRGTIDSYARWANMVGDESFEFKNILPYYQKSVKFTPPNYAKRPPGSPKVKYDRSAYSSSGGPLHVSYWNDYFPVSKYFEKGFQAVGLHEIDSIESGSLVGGYAQWPATLEPTSETRDSSETSFLQEAIAKSTLQVYQSTLAKKILFDDHKNAVGVDVVTAGIPYTLSATKEVILAAGAFRSPQLLMVSGIGSAATLKGLGIPVLSDLPGVGQNLWDQPWYGVSYQVNTTTNAQLFANPAILAAAEEQYLNNQTGPLTVFAGNYLAWEKIPEPNRRNFTASALSDLSAFPDDWPEIQYVPYAAPAVSVNDTDDYITIFMTLQKTTSRGNVTINSTDTADNPVVNLNWLLTDTDQQLAVQGLKRAREIAQAFGIVVRPEFLPGEQVRTDAEILEYIRDTVATIHHASCTCAMGKKGNPNAVVDSHGKVFGVNRLRVIDISAWPLLLPGQPMSGVYMLAEKVVDDIKNGV